jgi:Tfp pilus assembly protein FimT
MTDKGKVEDLEIRQFISAYCHGDVTSQQDMYDDLRNLLTLAREEAVMQERDRIIDAMNEKQKEPCANKEHDARWCAYCEARNDGLDLAEQIVKGG